MEYSSKSLDHLGIVAGVCKEIELAAEIDRIVGIDKRQKATTGESVEAMILNDMHRKILALFGNRYERIYCA